MSERRRLLVDRRKRGWVRHLCRLAWAGVMVSVLGFVGLVGTARARPASASGRAERDEGTARSDRASELTSRTRAVSSEPSEAERATVRGLQRASARVAGLDEGAWRSLRTRVRLAPLLPSVRITVGRGLQWSSSGTSWPGAEMLGSSTPDSDRLSYAVTAQWDLGRLLFSREEVVVQRDAQRAAAERTRLALRVTRLYARRCRLARAVAAGSASEHERGSLGEIDAALEILSGSRLPPGGHAGPCPAAPSGDADEPRAVLGAEPTRDGVQDAADEAAEPGALERDAASDRL